VEQTQETSSLPASAENAAAADDRPGGRLSVAFRALSHRNFRLFFTGQLVSLIGSWMQFVAQSWLVYRLTGSSLWLGSLGFAAQLPTFLLAPFGGTLADSHNRKRVLIATQTISMVLAFVLAASTLTGRVRLWQVFVLAVLSGVVNAFDVPARQAFLVDMVGKEDLINAIALNSSVFNGARIVGPAIAGILVATIGEGWCFLGNGMSYVAALGALWLMRVNISQPLASKGSQLQHIVEAFRFAKSAEPIRDLLLLMGVVSFMGLSYSVLMPVFADHVLHGGARGLGILMGATGAGALLGALMLAFHSGLCELGRWTALSTSGFGLSLGLFSLSEHFWLSAALLLPAGFCMMLQMSCSNTLIQALVPGELRGRVMALYLMMFMGMAPLGALLAGAVSVRLGAPLTVGIGATGCVVGAALFGLRLPKISVEARQLALAQVVTHGTPSDQMTSRVAA
jgi:MFS family permease